MKSPARLLAPALLALLAALSPARGEEGRDLLARSEEMHRTAALRYSGELTVFSRDGKVRSKGWRSYREGFAGDAKVLVRFTAPPEVRGVGFLSLGKRGGNADQWLYLPSMKRERRIASQDRDASFVGTDFSYEDMEEFDHRRYEVKLIGSETVDGAQCWLIEARPRDEGGRSVYARRLLALRKDLLYLAREELFREGEEAPVKRLLLSDLREVKGHWVAHRLEMTSLAKGSRTVVVLKDVAFDEPNPPQRFTLMNLNREGAD